MTIFKPGDTVRCIDNSGAPDDFEVGKTYQVSSTEGVDGHFLHIGESGMYSRRFELVSHVHVRTVVEPGSFADVSWAPHAEGIEVTMADGGTGLIFDRADLEALSSIFADLAKTLK